MTSALPGNGRPEDGPVMTCDAAVIELRRAYAEGSWGPGISLSDRTVGYVGADVPAEAIAAAGLIPVRLLPPAAPAGQDYLEEIIEPWLRAILGQLLIDGPVPLRYLIVANEGDGSRRLYQYVRELQLRGRLPQTLRTHFVDVVRRDGSAATAYNRVQLQRLFDTLGDWSGALVTDEALAATIEQAESRRHVLHRVCSRRRGSAPLLKGGDALAAIGAVSALTAGRHEQLISHLDADGGGQEPQAPAKDIRVYVTGSPLDRPELYDAISAAGGQVVGEDHDWGEQSIAYPLDRARPPREALIERWLRRPADSGITRSVHDRARHCINGAQRTSAEAVVCAIIAGDPSPAWDVPTQLAACATASLPALVLTALPYRGPLPESVTEQLADFLAKLASPSVTS
jgi:benzoyl-CoA reductase/2-hydroxyglutaryl-CoA dehydratase subunit BcrC/BadD/HgdB